MTTSRAPERRASPLLEIIGVYDASASPLGELAYWLRARRGASCALCRVTHTRAGEREEWRERASLLPAPFVGYHRNDQPADVAMLRAMLPAVFVRTSGTVRVLLERGAIEACAGSVDVLVEAILTRLDGSSPQRRFRRRRREGAR